MVRRNEIIVVPGQTGRIKPTSTSLLVSIQEIVTQGKCISSLYIRSRLRRACCLTRNVTQRLRNITEPSSAGVVLRDITPIILFLGEELEKLHPRIYQNVSRQLTGTPFGDLPEPDTPALLLNAVAKELFKPDITWGKIVSLFAISGGLALDCVRQGSFDYLQPLIEGTAEIIEEDVAAWIAERGGWIGLQEYIRPPVTDLSLLEWLGSSVSVFVCFALLCYFLRMASNQLI